ncbi:MAG: hypothetical protein KDC84_10475 [Crocinitomicaceae bacterium]|nr:hypothetical protein [Crocinitomicaceae bacterium]
METVASEINAYTLIEKEIIASLSFKDTHAKNQDPDLLKKLKNATSLGNLHRNKCRIIFQDSQGIKAVETTIWSTGKHYICLKGGMWLPIRNIFDVKIL